ncbi:hypothetical protein MVES_002075 [Malassezia vespertilionis]|uniref:Origin recognition complex subunit 3 winged helix C-terminal domain-containing protein n=2 Tax=Malassezia vespertilionis TaxID=2020962 RepID=A0A2N1JBP8_9BASI|nr:hypothetical protein MVES_002075 [Malassezia vespertilionis]
MFEKNTEPARMRYTAFASAWRRARERLLQLLHTMYAPALESVVENITKIPMLHGNVVHGVAIDASGCATYEGIAALLADKLCCDKRISVAVTPSQCTNLVAALSAFVTETVLQGERALAEAHRSTSFEAHDAKRASMAAMFYTHEPGDLGLLPAFFDESFGEEWPRVTLLLVGVEQYPVAVLNDFLQALLTWACTLPSAHAQWLSIVLVNTAPTPVLLHTRIPDNERNVWVQAVLTQPVLHLLDLSHMSFPDKTVFWEEVVLQFFLAPQTGLWLGRSMLAMVRRRYWHIEASWESVAQCIRLCYQHHFHTRAMSACADCAFTESQIEQSWTPEMYDAMRVALFAEYAPSAAPKIPRSVRPLLRDNTKLLRHLPEVRAQMYATETMRIIMMTVLTILFVYTDMHGIHGTRLSLTGCLATLLEWDPPFTDWDKCRTAASALTATTPTSAQLLALLQNLCATIPPSRIESMLDAMLLALQARKNVVDHENALIIDETTARLAHLKSTAGAQGTQSGTDTDPLAVRDVFTAWLTDAWADMRTYKPSGLGAAIWTYDFADPISAASEGAARASLLISLDEPGASLASMYAAVAGASGQRQLAVEHDWPEQTLGGSEVAALRSVLQEVQDAGVPDVCRAYALYKDSAKFINLADWFDAFSHSLEADARAENTPIPFQDALQVRFSLAINELAHMGLLMPTGRKPEHLTRMVWDLAVDGLPGDGAQ